MSPRRKAPPPPAAADKAVWYRDSGPKKLHACLTDDEAKALRRLARQFHCLVMDTLSGHPVPSSRALVQAIAAGRLQITRPAAPDKPAPPSPPQGGCPKD